MAAPKYQIIYDQLLAEINGGKYKEGDRLPSENELAEIHRVSRITSKKALEMLADQGLTRRIPGKGSFVHKAGSPQKPNASAEGPSPRNIGIVMDDINNVFGYQTFLTIEKLAESKGLFLLPRLAYGRRDAEEAAIQSLIRYGVDGIILMTSHCEDITPGLMELVIHQTPLVLVDRFLKGIPAPFVGTDNIVSTMDAVDYLVGLGHRNLTVLSRPYQNTTTIENRINGFIKSLAKHTLRLAEPKWITDIGSIISDHGGQEAIRADIDHIKALLASNSETTGVFATEYNIALLVQAAARELNRRIPEDISVICYDGPSDFLGQSFFTRVIQNERAIGQKAFELLLTQMKPHPELMESRFFYHADLAIGHSTGKPPRSLRA